MGRGRLAFSPSGSWVQANSRIREPQHLFCASRGRLRSFWSILHRCSRSHRRRNIFNCAISRRHRLCLQAQHDHIGGHDEPDAYGQHPNHAFDILTLTRTLDRDVLCCRLIGVRVVDTNSGHVNSSWRPHAACRDGTRHYAEGSGRRIRSAGSRQAFAAESIRAQPADQSNLRLVER